MHVIPYLFSKAMVLMFDGSDVCFLYCGIVVLGALLVYRYVVCVPRHYVVSVPFSLAR